MESNPFDEPFISFTSMSCLSNLHEQLQLPRKMVVNSSPGIVYRKKIKLASLKKRGAKSEVDLKDPVVTHPNTKNVYVNIILNSVSHLENASLVLIFASCLRGKQDIVLGPMVKYVNTGSNHICGWAQTTFKNILGHLVT